MGDPGFIEALLEFRKVANCRLGCPSTETAEGSGFEAIPAYLKGIATTASRVEKSLDGLAVIVDANGDPDGRFATVATAMRRATFPAPAKPFVIEHGPPRIGVFLIPGAGENGTLEDLLLKAHLERRRCWNNAWSSSQLARARFLPGRTIRKRRLAKIEDVSYCGCVLQGQSMDFCSARMERQGQSRSN
jgi:hypothetical protein